MPDTRSVVPGLPDGAGDGADAMGAPAFDPHPQLLHSSLMVRHLILADVRCLGNGVIGQLAALLVLVTPLVFLLRLMPQPEVIRDHQTHRGDGNPHDHEPAPALHTALLFRVLGRAFGAARGGLR